MPVREMIWRARNAALQTLWRARAGGRWPARSLQSPQWSGGSVPLQAGHAAADAASVLATARDLLADGVWPVFGWTADLAGGSPDWFRDPVTGTRAPAHAYCFSIPFRDEHRVGNIKVLWEVSRLQHVTVLAAAYHLCGDTCFAERALQHLRSWWRDNPPLRGIHWTSGIELGLRLLSWTWTRRLLDRFEGVRQAFEADPDFQRQLHAHQAWIATFHSRYSSANNHLVAEMTGLLAAARAFPMFRESGRWAALAAAQLEREIERQTFPDGLNRELAGDYHVFVTELFLLAAVEAEVAGPSLSALYWERLRRMLDALAGTIDAAGRAARQADGDEGRGLLLGPPGAGPAAVLASGAAILDPAHWWPAASGTAGAFGAAVLASVAGAGRRPEGVRRTARPSLFADAGISILRDLEPGPEEIWCRFDHGPHGMAPMAAHAHADALSFELRCGGREILVDPGTYCYHGETDWRRYFCSTIAHNTLELDGRSQAEQAGPFLWESMPRAELTVCSGLCAGEVAIVGARHDGYLGAPCHALHRRQLRLDRAARCLSVTDWVEAEEPVGARLAFHLHSGVECDLNGSRAGLAWANASGERRSAMLALTPELEWSAHRGETGPTLGWYSPRFGQKEPTTTLVGSGQVQPGVKLQSAIIFLGTPYRSLASSSQRALA